MDRSAVFQVVRETARDVLDVDPGGLTDATLLVEDLAVDSLALVEWAMVLEDTLQVELGEDATGGLRTIGDVVDLLADRTA